uniref:Secreted protein n=1 Tax=Trichogramma kaykai TaxID=54128 RepID=A0ABD2W0X9_9HYME
MIQQLTHRGSLEVELVSTLLLLLLRLDAVVSRCRPKRRNDSCAPQCRASAAACSSSSNGIFVFDESSTTCIRGKPGSIGIRCRTRRSRTRFRVQKKTREFPIYKRWNGRSRGGAVVAAVTAAALSPSFI